MELTDNDKAGQQEKREASVALPDTPDDYEYPSGLRFALLMISLYISMFLVALVGSKLYTPKNISQTAGF